MPSITQPLIPKVTLSTTAAAHVSSSVFPVSHLHTRLEEEGAAARLLLWPFYSLVSMNVFEVGTEKRGGNERKRQEIEMEKLQPMQAVLGTFKAAFHATKALIGAN